MRAEEAKAPPVTRHSTAFRVGVAVDDGGKGGWEPEAGPDLVLESPR